MAPKTGRERESRSNERSRSRSRPRAGESSNPSQGHANIAQQSQGQSAFDPQQTAADNVPYMIIPNTPSQSPPQQPAYPPQQTAAINIPHSAYPPQQFQGHSAYHPQYQQGTTGFNQQQPNPNTSHQYAPAQAYGQQSNPNTAPQYPPGPVYQQQGVPNTALQHAASGVNLQQPMQDQPRRPQQPVFPPNQQVTGASSREPNPNPQAGPLCALHNITCYTSAGDGAEFCERCSQTPIPHQVRDTIWRINITQTEIRLNEKARYLSINVQQAKNAYESMLQRRKQAAARQGKWLCAAINPDFGMFKWQWQYFLSAHWTCPLVDKQYKLCNTCVQNYERAPWFTEWFSRKPESRGDFIFPKYPCILNNRQYDDLEADWKKLTPSKDCEKGDEPKFWPKGPDGLCFHCGTRHSQRIARWEHGEAVYETITNEEAQIFEDYFWEHSPPHRAYSPENVITRSFVLRRGRPGYGHISGRR